MLDQHHGRKTLLQHEIAVTENHQQEWGMETLLINEQFVSRFKYWREGEVRIGMRFRTDLFEYVSKFNQNQRNQAFDLAWHLNQEERETVVTASSSYYTVWVNLRVTGGSLAGNPLADNSAQASPQVFPSQATPAIDSLNQPSPSVFTPLSA